VSGELVVGVVGVSTGFGFVDLLRSGVHGTVDRRWADPQRGLLALQLLFVLGA
jgi:hypothetical protein